MHCIRIGVLSVKIPHGTPLQFITFSITTVATVINIRSLNDPVSLTTAQQTVVGLKKQQVEKNRIKL